MATPIGIAANFFLLNPTAPGTVPNGSLFLDSTNANAFSVKDSGGSVGTVGVVGSSIFIKQMQAHGTIAINAAVSKRPDGFVQQADADALYGQEVCGYAQAAATDGELFNVLCVGANIVGALTGLGFAPGDEIYVNESGGYTNNPASLTNPSDSIIKVGIADCSAGNASSTVNDLIALAQVVARP